MTISKVIVVDRGLKQIIKNIIRMGRGRGPSVTVGIQGTDAGPSRGPEFNNASLAALHEFGSRDGKIPQRSFMRGTIDRERRSINKQIARAARNVAATGDFKKELGLVGERVRSDMIRTINNTIGLKENAPVTIAAKGSSVPLIDTGVLKNSITWKVHEK